MIDFFKLFSTTDAFKILSSEKGASGLSHAYLLVHNDAENLDKYLKIIAKMIMCDDSIFCNACRTCRLIDDGNLPDVISVGKNGKVASEDVAYLINESHIRPIEGDKKVFLINHAETMTDSAQNKLLKTLEEPPKGVHIVLGATKIETILQTVRSRCKKLEISSFNQDALFIALKSDYLDEEKLRQAVASSDGSVSGTVALYENRLSEGYASVVYDLILNMSSSKQVAYFSDKVLKVNGDISDFISELERFYGDLLRFLCSGESAVSNHNALEIVKNASGYSAGTVIHILEKINEAYKKIKFNTSPVMLVDWILLQILEGKYKWQKL